MSDMSTGKAYKSTAEFVRILLETASGLGLQVNHVVDADGQAGLDKKVSLGPNVLSFRAKDVAPVRVQASVVPTSFPMRIGTTETDIPADETSIRALTALLAGEGSVVHRWMKNCDELVILVEGAKFSFPIRSIVQPGPLGTDTDGIARREAQGLIHRLAQEAKRQGLEVVFQVRPDSGFGEEFVPRVDVAAGENRLTLWPGDDTAWIQASLMPGSSARIETFEIETRLDDETIRLLVALLGGEGRVIRRRVLGDTVDVASDHARLRLCVVKAPTILERILARLPGSDQDSFKRVMTE